MVKIDYTTLITMISSVGFPIVMCLLMWRQIDDIEEVHRNEVTELRKAIDNNTNVVTKLIEKLGV